MAVADPVTAPPAAPDGAAPAPAVPRPGELTNGWRIVMVVAWIGVVLAWSAVWGVSVQMGEPTWWLGTRATPTSPILRLLPFAGPVAVVIGAIVNLRLLAWVGTAAALVFGGYAIADVVDGLGRLAWVEVGVAAAGLLVSLTAFTGTYRGARVPGSGAPVASRP